MAALYLHLTLTILVSIRRSLRKRQRIFSKKRLSNRKMWVRPTIANRSTAGALQSTFLGAKELDRLTFFR